MTKSKTVQTWISRLIGKPQWQEYKTTDGWIALIRPEIGKVVRLKVYRRDYSEPVLLGKHPTSVQRQEGMTIAGSVFLTHQFVSPV